MSLGDIVKAGDVLLCFDEEAVAYAKRQSELEMLLILQITIPMYITTMNSAANWKKRRQRLQSVRQQLTIMRNISTI